MKSTLLLAAFGLLGLTSISSTAATYQFSGEIQKDMLTATSFGVAMGGGQVTRIAMPGDLKLEVSTPREDDNDAATVIRLLRPLKGTDRYEIMHEAKTVGSSSKERSISYLVCGAQVTFLTPAPAITPKCVS